MVVTANLAKGALLMSRKKCIVKRLNSIQNFGAMDILCTDKTGTLTRDKIVLEKYIDLHGQPNHDVLEYAYLNSYHQTGLKNLLDVAVLEHVDLNDELKVERQYPKIDEIPFDFVRRRMSVVLQKDANTHLLICKGAVEEILDRCTRAETDADLRNDFTEPLTGEACQEAQRLARDLNEDGLRVVAIAYKEVPASSKAYEVDDESELVLAGFAGFLDPPKESAEPAIKVLQEHGVTVKVLTGDNDIVTRKVCRQVGLQFDSVVLGNEIEPLDDDQLADLSEKTVVFAKLTPAQKARIIRALQRRGHTVGYLGDGINDAAALRDADVGISVDSAADIAKESADIIMLEKDLLVLEEGVLEGRNTFGNIIKYIKMTASSNFGNVFSVLVASAFIPFLPMLPIQLLVQNLLYDFSQTTIPFDRVDCEYLRRPRQWYAGDIGRFMLFIGPISSVFDITTFVLLWFVFRANSSATQALFQSGWFIEGLLSQTLIVHMIRTQKIPFLQSRAAWPVMLTTAAIMAAGIAIPFLPFGRHMGLEPMPRAYFPWLAATLLAYCVLTQTIKGWYIHKFRMWL
ncbi:MAG TPA: magnesium-translocating P-type ATPase, partial [Vicinamibacterales bacterium]